MFWKQDTWDIYTKVSIMSHTTTEEKCGMDFSPLSGEATSGEKKFPYESRVAEPRVTNREIYHATFLLSGGVP